MGAPANATYIVQDPNATLTAEKVTGTDLILTPLRLHHLGVRGYGVCAEREDGEDRFF